MSEMMFFFFSVGGRDILLCDFFRVHQLRVKCIAFADAYW